MSSFEEALDVLHHAAAAAGLSSTPSPLVEQPAPRPECGTCGDTKTVEWFETVTGYGPPDEYGDPTPVPERQPMQAPCPDCPGGR